MDKSEAAQIFREALATLGPDAGTLIAEAVGALKAKQDQRIHASEPVTIYALRDIGTGPNGAIAEDGTIIHPRGFAQQVSPTDRREILRGGLYGDNPPWPESHEVAAHPATPAAKAEGSKQAGELGAQKPTPFALTSLPNVNSKLARVLEDAKGEDGQSLNLGTLEGFRAVKPETLAALPGVGAKLADILKSYVAETYKEE